MDGAHFHLMLNHFPIIGMTFASPLLLLAWGTKSEDLIRVGLGLVSLTGLLAVATFLTGEPAEEVVENLPGVAKRLGVLAWTNNLGGQISHAELRKSASLAASVAMEGSARETADRMHDASMRRIAGTIPR